MSGLPIIDLGGLTSPSPGDRQAVASELRSACVKNGFFYATNSGIAAAETTAVLDAAARFFALPDAVKLTVAKDNSPCGRGYERMGAQRLEAGAQFDRKEGFVLGTDLPADDWRVIAGWPQHGSNQWPMAMPEWRTTLEGYHSKLVALAGTIMRGLALSLDVAEDYFADCARESIATLRLLHYPPQPRNAGADARGAGAHTDWGAITILLQDGVGGLQVHDGGDHWIDAPPIPGTFIINLGDLVPRWTNGRYRSTMHRVINRSGRERYSAAFFFDGRGDYVSDVVPTCIAAGEIPKFAPLSVNEHLAEMFRTTHAA